MTKLRQPAPEYTIDPQGNRLVHLPLANTSERATLYAEDYERMVADGYSARWAIASTGGHHKYVLVNARSPGNGKRSLTVARLVAQAGRGQIVGYADGDRLNLRRDNLRVHEGRAKAAAGWLLPKAKGTPSPSQEPRAAREKTPRTSPIPTPPRTPYTPHVRDARAIAARVQQTIEARKEGATHAVRRQQGDREQMAAQAAEVTA